MSLGCTSGVGCTVDFWFVMTFYNVWITFLFDMCFCSLVCFDNFKKWEMMEWKKLAWNWLPAWWALWLPWWPPVGCNNALMYLLIFTMNFCYCFIVVFCWKYNLLLLLDNLSPGCYEMNIWHWFYSSPPSTAYMHQWIKTALVTQIMACCLLGAKPSSKLMLGYCQLDT